jgi:hypothetical protein
MVYLDYLLYIIIIVLFYILMNKIILNETKEGFKHKEGRGFIAAKSKKKEKEEKLSSTEVQVIVAGQSIYQVAREVAIVCIKVPWKIISSIVNMMVRMVQNINDMLKPMYDFLRQMGQIVKRIVLQMYDRFAKIFKQGFAIMRNLPAFIKKYADIAINYTNTMVNEAVNIATSIFTVFQSVFNSLLQMPQMMFNFMNTAMSFGLNSFNLAMKIPTSGLKLATNVQDKVVGFMDKQ